MNRTSLVNLLASAGVALIVSTAFSGASSPPATHGVGGGVTSAKPLAAPSGPSLQQQITALRKRVDYLQNREADTRKTAQSAVSVAWDAVNVTDCIVDAIYITFDDEGNAVSSDASDDADAIPTLDPACLEEEAS